MSYESRTWPTLESHIEHSALLQKAFTLGSEGKYKEALDIFAGIANKQQDNLERAAMLLNVVNIAPKAGQIEFAKTELDTVRALLSDSSFSSFGAEYRRYHRYLIILSNLEEARISEAEGKFQDALDKIDKLKREFTADLRDAAFQGLYWAGVERERGFILTHLGSTEAALPILERVNEADPHDRFTLYYLGTCYVFVRRYPEAQEKLEESIALRLPPDWEGRARYRLGAACYELKDYERAKSELELAAKTAPKEFIQHVRIWRWLEYTCVSLGLKAEAELYAQLDRPS